MSSNAVQAAEASIHFHPSSNDVDQFLILLRRGGQHSSRRFALATTPLPSSKDSGLWSSYRTANAILNHNAHKNRDIRHSPRYTKGWLLGLLHSFYGDQPNCCYDQGKPFEYLLILEIEKLIYLSTYLILYYFEVGCTIIILRCLRRLRLTSLARNTDQKLKSK